MCMLLQAPAHPLEHRISSLMTVRVVKKLKVVEIQHQNTKWCLAALHEFYLLMVYLPSLL